MKSNGLTPRVAVLFLVLSLVLPAPSLALRSEATQEASGLEEIRTGLGGVATAIGLTPNPAPLLPESIAPPPATAGLEEKFLTEAELFADLRETFGEFLRRMGEALERSPSIYSEVHTMYPGLRKWLDPGQWEFLSRRQRAYSESLSKMSRQELSQEAAKFENWTLEIEQQLKRFSASTSSLEESELFHGFFAPLNFIQGAEDQLKEADMSKDRRATLEGISINAEDEIAFLREILYRWDNKQKSRSHILFPAEGTMQGPTSGLEEGERAIRDLAEKWKLTNPFALHLVGVTPGAVKVNSFLQVLRRGPVSIGDVTLVMIPRNESERVSLLLPFMGESRAVSVVGYQGLRGEGQLVSAFLKTARRMGLNPRRLGELETQAFRVFFQQLIHNISGVSLEAIRPDDLVDFERALQRLRSV